MKNMRLSGVLSGTLLFLAVFTLFTISVTAQRAAVKPSWGMEIIYPHDFSDEYYQANGVLPDKILGRRTGTDGLSVMEKLMTPELSPVRVLATVPAYNTAAQPMFWYPLGDLPFDGLSNDRAGLLARQTAQQYPMYLFPDTRIDQFNSFANARQAPILHNDPMAFGELANPLGLREVFVVNYTSKAYDKENFALISWLIKKNGLALDGTPLIASMDDLLYLERNDMVTVEPLWQTGLVPSTVRYAIAPVYTDNLKVATDAFLWMATEGGQPLAAETIFMDLFNCMKKTGGLCSY